MVLRGRIAPRLCEPVRNSIEGRESQEARGLVDHTDGGQILRERAGSDLAFLAEKADVPIDRGPVGRQGLQIVGLTKSGKAREFGLHRPPCGLSVEL